MSNPTPYGYVAPQAPKRRTGRKVLIGCGSVAGAVVLLIIILGVVAALGNHSSTSTSRGNRASGHQAPGAAKIGAPVRDGKFQFTVTAVTHAKHAGGLLGGTAQGRYTILHVTVKNIGGQAQTLDASNQYVYDASGRQFSADSAASSQTFFLTQINPGNEVTGTIAFDLPNGDHAVKAELHDSLFSNGVTVSLP
ncbi:MAG TPA: DUF4352 domain-containing protein [Streptosporangiaceae bacterium]|nr:DUF4352 domain-containing protein [Streptosporangiaceae bacterium]